MRKLVVSVFMTLDGVMEAPGGEPGHPHTGWAGEHMGPAEEEYKFAEVREAKDLLIGRVTYESFAGAWPTYEGEFADRMNGMPKHVVSTTLHDPAWSNTDVVSSDVPGAVNRLKAEDGGPLLVVGSRILVHSLMGDDLVDEYRLTVFPVVVGGGARVFPEKFDKMALELADHVTFDSGIIELTYRVAR